MTRTVRLTTWTILPVFSAIISWWTVLWTQVGQHKLSSYHRKSLLDKKTQHDWHRWIYNKNVSNQFACFSSDNLHNARTIDGCELSPSPLPVNTMNHCTGSTRNPYLMKFSRRRRKPPIVRSKKPQFTKPEKSLKLELHEKSESRGLWILEGNFVVISRLDLAGIEKFKGSKLSPQQFR